jgi:hypothetical protein
VNGFDRWLHYYTTPAVLNIIDFDTVKYLVSTQIKDFDAQLVVPNVGAS